MLKRHRGFPKLLIVALTLCGSAHCSSAEDGTPTPTNTVAANVNAHPITIAEVETEARKDPAYATYLKIGRTAPEITNTFRRAALSNLIALQLMEEDGRKRGVITDQLVTERIDTLITRQFGSRERLSKALPLLHTSEELLLKQLRQAAVGQLYLEALFPEVPVKEEEIRNTFEGWKKIGRLRGSLAESRAVNEESIRAERRMQLVQPEMKKLTEAARIEILLPPVVSTKRQSPTAGDSIPAAPNNPSN